MRKTIILLIALLLSIPAIAQLKVKEGSFKEVPGFVNINPDQNYQTDDNDLPFAVIKVRTENITDKQRRDLRFESNLAVGIMLEYKTGEVWVYLTAKYADYLKISHPDFSSTEFTIPFDLQPKKGYEMLLVNKTKEETGSGSLTINTKPENGATIMLNGVLISQNTPYINDMMAVGTYEITVSKVRYKTVTKTVKVKKGSKQVVDIEMPIDVADITIQTDAMTDIYIDGFLRRKGTFVGELNSGIHEIEARKPNHKTVVKTINVVAGKPETFMIELTPIYGVLNIQSEPSGATVYIDNNCYGQTPLSLNSLMIGEHTVVIEKSGFISSTKTITLDNNKTLYINEKLPVGMTNKTFTVDGVSFEMVAVEGGTFKMGAQKDYIKGDNYDPNCSSDESPVHQVTLSDYYIGKYEVTNELWTVVWESGSNKDNSPVKNVNWYNAVVFCNKLSEKCGRTPYYKSIKVVKDKKSPKTYYITYNHGTRDVYRYNDLRDVVLVEIDYTSNGFRLPTEAEWEYAAKGGNNNKDTKYEQIVRTNHPNELGIHYTTWGEWCFDEYEFHYKGESQINPVIIPKHGPCVVRGGSNRVTSRDCMHQIEEEKRTEYNDRSVKLEYQNVKGSSFRVVVNK